MNRSSRKVYYLLLLIIIIGAYYFFGKTDRDPNSEEYRVIDVIDGDTVVINDAKNSRVRYLGIDTPEIALQDSPGDPMSKEAWDYNAGLVQGKKVRLELDEEKYDVYGRILAYVYVDELLVNQELLKEGLATVLIIEPNNKHSEIIYDAVGEARRKNKGIWGPLSSLHPPNSNHRFRVDIDKVDRYEGKRVVVGGEVIGSRKSEKVIALSMEDKLDIVIFPNTWDNFEHFGIDPENFYLQKNVEVTGRVRMRRGKPSIVVDHPMFIRRQN